MKRLTKDHLGSLDLRLQLHGFPVQVPAGRPPGAERRTQLRVLDPLFTGAARRVPPPRGRADRTGRARCPAAKKTFSADISCSVMLSFFSNLLSLSREGNKNKLLGLLPVFFVAAEGLCRVVP